MVKKSRMCGLEQGRTLEGGLGDKGHFIYTSSAEGRNVNGLDVCYACKIRRNKLSNRSNYAFKRLLTAL